MTTLKEFLERMEKDRKRNDPTPRKTHITTDPISISLEAFHMAQLHGDWNLVTECLRKQRLRLDGDRTTTNPRLV